MSTRYRQFLYFWTNVRNSSHALNIVLFRSCGSSDLVKFECRLESILNHNMATKEPINDEDKPSRRLRTGGKPRRRPGGGPRNGAPKEEHNEVAEEGESKPYARRTRPPTVRSPSVSLDLVGTQATGKVFDIVKRFNTNYGFITVDTENTSKFDQPKIYFSLKDYTDADFIVRRGYLVKFTIEKDDLNRPYAANVTLTDEGKVEAEKREVKIAANKAAEGTTAHEGNGNTREPREAREPRDAKKREPREQRPPREPREPEVKLNLKVACEGHTEIKDIEASLYQPIGRLKYQAVELFGAVPTYALYGGISADTPKGVFLTKALLRSLKDGDKLYLGTPHHEVKESD